MPAAVSAGAYLHHLQLSSGNPERLALFYADAMDMRSGQLANGDWLCRGPGRRIIFTQGPDKGLGFGAFACRDAPGLAAIRDRAVSQNAEILPSPRPALRA